MRRLDVEPILRDPARFRSAQALLRRRRRSRLPCTSCPDEQVVAAVDALVESLDPALNRLLVATVDHEVAGWLVLVGQGRVPARLGEGDYHDEVLMHVRLGPRP